MFGSSFGDSTFMRVCNYRIHRSQMSPTPLRVMLSSSLMYTELRSPPNQTCMGLECGTQVPKPVEGVSAKKNTWGGTETAARSYASFGGWGLFLIVASAP